MQKKFTAKCGNVWGQNKIMSISPINQCSHVLDLSLERKKGIKGQIGNQRIDGIQLATTHNQANQAFYQVKNHSGC